MQKVAWPSTIVQNEKGMSTRSKAERSAMPVMMPGSAIGRMTSSEIASRPKNFVRDSGRGGERAEDQREDRRDRRDLTERQSACQTSGRSPGDGEPLRG